jgi:hypothetical protein
MIACRTVTPKNMAAHLLLIKAHHLFGADFAWGEEGAKP